MYIACNLQHHPSAFVSQIDSAGEKTRGIDKSISGVARCQSSISVPAQTSRMDSIEQILEAELAALRLIVPELNLEKHKGQAGILARQIFMFSLVKVETTAQSSEHACMY